MVSSPHGLKICTNRSIEVIPARPTSNAPPTSDEDDIEMATDPEADEEEEEAKEEDSDDMISKPQPKKRKPKKVWPAGRNGIKKKRIVKAEMKIDEKGYMGVLRLSFL